MSLNDFGHMYAPGKPCAVMVHPDRSDPVEVVSLFDAVQVAFDTKCNH
jgi:hypothetical protein